MQDLILSRLHRINGQIKAIERMYQSNRFTCIDIVTQIQSAKVGLSKVAQMLLSDEAKRCTDKGDLKELEKIVNKTFQTI